MNQEVLLKELNEIKDQLYKEVLPFGVEGYKILGNISVSGQQNVIGLSNSMQLFSKSLLALEKTMEDIDEKIVALQQKTDVKQKEEDSEDKGG